jgi:hypothetical protein
MKIRLGSSRQAASGLTAESEMASLFIHFPVTKEELVFLSGEELRLYCEKLAILKYHGVPRYIAERVAYMFVMLEPPDSRK